MPNTPRNRSVSINPTVKCVEILSIYDYTPTEIAASWYDEEDMNKITQRCFKVLQKMEYGGSKKGQKYCTRGLEGHSTLGSIAKKKARAAATAAVLEEQARQWNQNEQIDVQAISDAYRRTTSSCLMWAQVIGNSDRQAAEAYLYPDDEEEEDEVQATVALSSTRSDESAIIKRHNQRRIGKVPSTSGKIQTSARAA